MVLYLNRKNKKIEDLVHSKFEGITFYKKNFVKKFSKTKILQFSQVGLEKEGTGQRRIRYSYQLKSNLEQNKEKNKPNTLKEEISMLLQMLASRNQNHASNQVCENLNKELNTHKEENLEQKAITMSDIEWGI